MIEQGKFRDFCKFFLLMGGGATLLGLFMRVMS